MRGLAALALLPLLLSPTSVAARGQVVTAKQALAYCNNHPAKQERDVSVWGFYQEGAPSLPRGAVQVYEIGYLRPRKPPPAQLPFPPSEAPKRVIFIEGPTLNSASQLPSSGWLTVRGHLFCQSSSSRYFIPWIREKSWQPPGTPTHTGKL